MFIDLKDLESKYALNIKGVIHVGAHLLEELESYQKLNIQNLLWIEANEELVKTTQKLYDDQTILNYVVYDEDDVELSFNVASNGQSSSVLNFGSHSAIYPHISFYEQRKVKTKTLKSILVNEGVDVSKFNMLNLDIQGVELRALRGLGTFLSNIDYVYTEINDDEVYENNDMLCDIDKFLEDNNFTRKETYIVGGNWGDAFYMRNK